MSAEAATLLLEESGDQTVDGFEVRQTWQVFTTSNTDGAVEVLLAANLPPFNAAYYGDTRARVSSRRPLRQRDSTTHWNVEIAYTISKQNDQDRQTPPTLRPTKRSAKVRWIEQALMVDRDGAAILTSAKTPFNPPITISVPHSVVTFQRWESTFSTQTQRDYVGKVNSGTFGVFAAGEVLCTNIEANEEWEQDADGNLQRYWLVTYEFEASPSPYPWQPFKILDADYWFIDPSDSQRKPIFVDKNGTYHGDPDDALGATPVPSPIPLDGPDGDLGDVLQVNEIPADIHYLEFDIYEEADFDALNLNVD